MPKILFFLPPFCFKDKNVEIKLMRCEVIHIYKNLDVNKKLVNKNSVYPQI